MKRPVIITAGKPRRRRSPKATIEATPPFPRIVGEPAPSGAELSAEELRRRADAVTELLRELVRRATGRT